MCDEGAMYEDVLLGDHDYTKSSDMEGKRNKQWKTDTHANQTTNAIHCTIEQFSGWINSRKRNQIWHWCIALCWCDIHIIGDNCFNFTKIQFCSILFSCCGEILVLTFLHYKLWIVTNLVEKYILNHWKTGPNRLYCSTEGKWINWTTGLI